MSEHFDDPTVDADPTGAAGAEHGHVHASHPHLTDADHVTIAGTPKSDGTGPRVALPDFVADNYREMVATEPGLTWEALAKRFEQDPTVDDRMAAWARQQKTEKAAAEHRTPEKAAEDRAKEQPAKTSRPTGRASRPTSTA